MELNYVPSESTVKPQAVSFDAFGVRMTRNVTEVVRNNGDQETTYYTYEECVLTHPEFQSYTNIMLIQNMAPTALNL